MKPRSPALRRRLSRIRVLILDVDGVLTDGGLYCGPRGEPLRKFNIKDGMGIRLVREAGLVVAFITGEGGGVLRRRAAKLGIRHLLTRVEDKRAALKKLLATLGLAAAEAAYVGDDLNDLPAMEQVGVAVAVSDAAEPVRRAADLVTRRRGGEGAVREVCELLLACRRA